MRDREWGMWRQGCWWADTKDGVLPPHPHRHLTRGLPRLTADTSLTHSLPPPGTEPALRHPQTSSDLQAQRGPPSLPTPRRPPASHSSSRHKLPPPGRTRTSMESPSLRHLRHRQTEHGVRRLSTAGGERGQLPVFLTPPPPYTRAASCSWNEPPHSAPPACSPPQHSESR